MGIRVDEPLVHLDGAPTIQALAASELERIDRILDSIDVGWLPERTVPGYGVVVKPPARGTHEQPWNCRYCPYQPTCSSLPTEAVPLALLERRRDAELTGQASDDATRNALLAVIRALPPERQAALRERWTNEWPVFAQCASSTNSILEDLTELIVEVMKDRGRDPHGSS